ncbi:MAG: DinB family protein [Cyclobacteriaceae bacterium]|nr:DinB family protein [Cyclobacteriaceae bacterium]
MQLSQATGSILTQIEFVIGQMKNEDYTKPVDVFNNSTIGQHVRHTLEFFQCLMGGYESGVVSYDKRNHDTSIETDKELALTFIINAKKFINSCDMLKPLLLEINYAIDDTEDIIVDSNMGREVTYNIEHAIHHMAIIKIGLRVLCPDVELPYGFGVAISTIRYNKEIEV